MAQRIAGPLARRTRTVNHWNGTVSVQLIPYGAGRKEWDCSIIIDSRIIGNDRVLWPALNHEMLHALSVGLNAGDYVGFVGWEEGVVEKLQRLLGRRVLREIGEQPYKGR